jgi:hypothetical protein
VPPGVSYHPLKVHEYAGFACIVIKGGFPSLKKGVV